MEDFKDIHVVHTCKVCGVKIKTFWNKEEQFCDGNFMALDARLSEIFKVFQPVMTEIVCMECFVFNRHLK